MPSPTTAVLPTLTPPANPVVVYSTADASGNWTCAESTGTVLASATTTPVHDVAQALVAASVDLSTLVTLLAPCGVHHFSGQLNDMATITGR
jgi:hypothetical protein